MVERNAGLPAERRIEFRVGIHLGDVVEESDGDLMGEGVNIAARLEGVAKPGGICLSEDAYRQVKSRLDLAVSDLGPTELKNIAEPMRLYSLQVGLSAQAKPAAPLPQTSAPRLSIVVLPFTNMGGDPEQEYFVDGVTESLTTDLYQSSVRLTRLGFPNHPQHDSRWQTEGRLPWGLRLRCGRTFRARNFVAWRRGLRTPLRRAGCLRSQQCSTVPRGKRRRRSAAWIGRPTQCEDWY